MAASPSATSLVSKRAEKDFVSVEASVTVGVGPEDVEDLMDELEAVVELGTVDA